MSRSFTAFAAGSPLAAPPFLATDLIPLIRGGLTQHASAPTLISSNLGITSSLSTGAAGDGVTDDTAILQTLFNGLSTAGGGFVLVPAGVFHYIAGALTVPVGVQVVGAAPPFQGWGEPADPPVWSPLTKGCGFFVNGTTGTLSMSAGTRLSSLKIFRFGLLAAPTAAQVIASVTQWGTETGKAVQITIDNADGIVLEDLFIVGFNQGIYSTRGDFYSNRVYIDCFNGLYVGAAGDINVHSNVRCEPWYGLSVGAGVNGVNWRRPGVAFNLAGGGAGTGTSLRDCFAFGWDVGFKAAAGNMDTDNCVYDSPCTQSVTPQTAFQFTSTAGESIIKNPFINNAATGISIAGPGGPFEIVNPRIYCPNGGVAAVALTGSSFGRMTAPHIISSGGGPAAFTFGADGSAGNWQIISPYLDGFPTNWITLHSTWVGRVEAVAPNFYNGATVPSQAARNQGCFVSAAQLAATHAIPGAAPGTTSATFVMAGFGVTLIPNATGKLLVMFTGSGQNNTINDAITVQLRYGTAPVPNNGDPDTGIAIGPVISIPMFGSGTVGALAMTATLGLTDGTRLTCGTAYWFDLAFRREVGGIATITGNDFELIELP